MQLEVRRVERKREYDEQRVRLRFLNYNKRLNDQCSIYLTVSEYLILERIVSIIISRKIN